MRLKTLKDNLITLEPLENRNQKLTLRRRTYTRLAERMPLSLVSNVC